MGDEIDDTTWYQQTCARLTSVYLAGDNPRAQSGFTGDQTHWTQARSLIAEPINRDGAFLDIVCAYAFLLERLFAWANAKGHRSHPYAFDISPALIASPRERLPPFAYRLF